MCVSDNEVRCIIGCAYLILESDKHVKTLLNACNICYGSERGEEYYIKVFSDSIHHSRTVSIQHQSWPSGQRNLLY